MSDASPATDWLTKVAFGFDEYDRKARLSPAGLCLAPLMVMGLSLYPSQLVSLKGLAGLLVAVGLLYLLADIARTLGKKHEARLWQSWGGAPSTQVLRHRDQVFSPVIKQHYHRFLGERIGATFPTEGEETANPLAADAVYAAGSGWLREATRDTKKFAMLFRENVNYGYRRNGYGVRWLGLGICLTVVVWVLLRHGLDSLKQRLQAAPNIEAILSAGEVATLLAAVFMAAIWLFYFSEATVRLAAFTYAQRLVEACGPLSKPATSKASATT